TWYISNKSVSAVSEIRKYLELMNMKSDNIENEFNQQNMPIEEDDSSTPVQLATSVGSSSSQHSAEIGIPFEYLET
ncbi:hypothetical protein L9F63_012479, partial [Diploptera punctata]